MTKETADQLIRFAEENLEPTGSIWFFGAEPFCNFEIIRYILETSQSKGHKWKFGATTNATLLTEDKIQFLKKYNFGFNCSIDGLKETHNANRIYPDGTGSWDDAWKGLELIRKHINPNPQLRWTVTPSTVKGLADGIKTFVEVYKLTSIAVDMVYEAEWKPEDLAALKNELLLFKENYAKWIQQGIPVFSMFIRDANSAIMQQERQWCSRCGLGQGAVGIDWDGTIYPCHRFIDSHKIKIGSIYDGFNATRKEWMDKWCKIAPYCETPSKCLICNYKKACNGGCLAVNYDVFGITHANPEAFCNIKQMIVDTFADLCKSLRDNPTFQKANPQAFPKQQMPQNTLNQAPKPTDSNSNKSQGGAQ